jgi:hypothetical protein
MLHCMRRWIAIPFVVCAASLLVSVDSSSQGIKGRELLGLRAGGTISTGGVNEIFGNGSELEIHFIEGLNPWLGINISLSSHNFGESNDRQKNIDYTGLDRPVDLNIFSVTVAAVAVKDIKGKWSSTFEGGIGLYTVNGIIQAGLYEGTRTNNQFGFYGGAGLLYRLTKSFSINANAKYHYVFTGDDLRHTIYFYTSEDRISFYQIAVGIAIFTG